MTMEIGMEHTRIYILGDTRDFMAVSIVEDQIGVHTAGLHLIAWMDSQIKTVASRSVNNW